MMSPNDDFLLKYNGEIAAKVSLYHSLSSVYAEKVEVIDEELFGKIRRNGMSDEDSLISWICDRAPEPGTEEAIEKCREFYGLPKYEYITGIEAIEMTVINCCRNGDGWELVPEKDIIIVHAFLDYRFSNVFLIRSEDTKKRHAGS